MVGYVTVLGGVIIASIDARGMKMSNVREGYFFWKAKFKKRERDALHKQREEIIKDLKILHPKPPSLSAGQIVDLIKKWEKDE